MTMNTYRYIPDYINFLLFDCTQTSGGVHTKKGKKNFQYKVIGKCKLRKKKTEVFNVIKYYSIKWLVFLGRMNILMHRIFTSTVLIRLSGQINFFVLFRLNCTFPD